MRRPVETPHHRLCFGVRGESSSSSQLNPPVSSNLLAICARKPRILQRRSPTKCREDSTFNPLGFRTSACHQGVTVSGPPKTQAAQGNDCPQAHADPMRPRSHAFRHGQAHREHTVRCTSRLPTGLGFQDLWFKV